MSAKIIDGKAASAEIRIELKKRADELKTRGVEPCLAVILVGEDPASKIYVRNKAKACDEVGIRSEVIRLPEETSEDALLCEIARINADPSIHGLLVQMPLPRHISERAVIHAIDPKKDVDGFHAESVAALFSGETAPIACTPKGAIALLKRAGIPLDGANAVVIGRSNIVGKPMAMLLLRENCTVTMCHSRTKNLAEITKTADVLVAAIGKPRFVTRDMVKPGAAVIDVGINRLPDGKVVGDVDFSGVSEIAGYITPVPGGVGPMTITMLMENTLEAAEHAV